MHSRDEVSIVSKAISIQKRKHPLEQVDNDILFVILEKLGWIDRIRATAVCKKWLQEITKIPYHHQGKFPWLFSQKVIDGAGCQVKLTDESSKRSYVTESGERLFGASVCASKFGWTLMMSRVFKKPTNFFKFFVYCPFNCKLMQLPTLSRQADRVLTTYPSKRYTFSSKPTLPDCVFFAVLCNNDSQKIEIRTCRIGDKEWTCSEINLSITYVIFSVECIRGLLYVVFVPADTHVEGDRVLNSHVGIFDPESQEWKFIHNEKGIVKSNYGQNVHGFLREWYIYLNKL